MNDFLIYSLSLSSIIIISILYSYKYQKDFSNLSQPSKIFISFLSCVIVSSLMLFSLICMDIFSLTTPNILNSSLEVILDKFSNDNKKNGPNSNKILLVISLVNFLFYVLIPFVFFYFVEEKSINSYPNQDEEHTGGNKENIPLFEEEYENNCLISQGINPTFHSERSAFNFNLFKNYFYYLLALTGFNIVYLVTFKMNYFDTYKNMMRYSVVPDGLRKYSHLFSEMEILGFINFGVLVSLGKLLFLIYIPYGAGKLTSSLIENLKSGETMKNEYNHLNNNFSKNYETIKNITSQKLMTGRPLTKKEKIILKNCKETETILQHKQEVLEDKFSNWQMFIFYSTLPFKFVSVFMSISFVLFFVISKILLLYTQINKSLCGIDCGYVANTHKLGLSIQTLLELVKNQYMQIAILFLFFSYLTVVGLNGLSNLGIVNLAPRGKSYSTSEIRTSKILTLAYYSIFFLLIINIILEVFSISPDFSLFFNTGCDIYNIDSEGCLVSNFGIFYLKFYVNFSYFKYYDIFFSSCLIALMSGMIIYYPVKTTLNDWNSENQEKFEC